MLQGGKGRAAAGEEEAGTDPAFSGGFFCPVRIFLTRDKHFLEGTRTNLKAPRVSPVLQTQPGFIS